MNIKMFSCKLEPIVSRLEFPVSSFQALSRMARTARDATIKFLDESGPLRATKPMFSKEDLLSRLVKLETIDLKDVASIMSYGAYHILWPRNGTWISVDTLECSGLFDSWRLSVKKSAFYNTKLGVPYDG